MIASPPKLALSRSWSMPTGSTFSLPPVAALLDRWLDPGWMIVDPFAGDSSRATYTNDLRKNTSAQFHLDAREYLRSVCIGYQFDAALFDPPYSPRQIKDCYESVGLVVTQTHTQHARLVAETKDLLAPLIRPGGIVITCGWNSQGMGEKRGFVRAEILLVGHGGSHNDTIVTVERKARAILSAPETERASC